MAHRLLFFLFICFSFFVNAQVQGSPPPCGITPVYVCDDNNDGFEELNLRELFPFSSFCAANQGEVESDYHAISYYETQDDMINQINAIANPESYTNISNPQIIYFRANAINPGGTFEFLSSSDDFVEIKELSTQKSFLRICDDNHDGIATFDLTAISLFCGNPPINYSIEYYELPTDANTQINKIVDPTNYSSNSKTVYARVEYLDTEYVEIAEIGLTVSVLPVTSNITDFTRCDDLGDKDGLTLCLLASKDSNILKGEADSEVFYYEDEDLKSLIDKNSSYQNISNPQAIYFKVINKFGCYNTGAFNINVLLGPTINQPTPIEVCDDISGDGIETFDLNSKTAEIYDGSIADIHISYHLTRSDAENYVNFLPTTYTNKTASQTIYVRVENWTNNGCASVTSLDLIVSDCTNSGVIELNTFYDANRNDIFEDNEDNFVNGIFTYEINNDGIKHVVSSSTGTFSIISKDDNNTYDISYSLYDEYLDCYNVGTFLYENISATNGDKVFYNFPVIKLQECNDIAVYLVSYAPPRPGFDYYNRLIIKNKGLETVSSGTIEFVHDPMVTFNTVTNVDSQYSVNNTATGFTLDFVDLKPNEQESVVVSMNVPIPTSLGTLLTNTATYSVTDLSTENNTSILSETVIGSYDPNDIAESHGPEILYNEFGNDDYLYYTVRFQNVGTADAINVSIDNTLNAKLDKSTIQMLSASHDYVFTRTDDLLNWQFDDIHLPSEDMDEPNSHGYVYYKIKPLAGYSIGDVIPNTAEIYFDFNPAVVTNTFNTEFVTTLSSETLDTDAFLVLPNPTSDVVKLKFSRISNKQINISIYDIHGKEIINVSKNLNNRSVELDVRQLAKGVYFLKVNTGDLEKVKKMIIN